MRIAIIGSGILSLSLIVGCKSADLGAIKDGLGDGKLANTVPITAIADAAEVARPGSKAIILAAEAQLKALTGKVEQGPFGGLPYTTTRQVVLKDGTRISEEQIAQIIEILTPVVPAAIVRVVLPADYTTSTVETPTTAPATTTTLGDTSTSTTAPALDPDVAAALEE